jgi:L-cystine transport system substrate-binding protein
MNSEQNIILLTFNGGYQLKKLTITAALMTTILLAAGCGAKSAANSEGGASTTPAATTAATPAAKPVKKIIIGTGTQFKNVNFIDDKGNLTGYDVELVKEIGKRLPDYEFEFKTSDFSSLFTSLETNKIDVVAHEIEKNPKREEKYLFNKEAYNPFPVKIVVNEKRNDINSIDDLKGKKVLASAASNEAYILEQYNKSHNNAINIVYAGKGDDAVEFLKSGRVDATLGVEWDVPLENQARDAQEKAVGEILASTDAYFLFRKDEQELADKFDEAIKAIKADGTLAKLSVQWFGKDYTGDIGKGIKK